MGLELMLSTSSPSDTEHRFSSCDIQGGYPFYRSGDSGLLLCTHHFNQADVPDPLRYYDHGGHPPPSHGGHLRRVFGNPLHLQPQRDYRGRFMRLGKNLPAVPIVKGLRLLRHFRREIHLRTLSVVLARSFVGLERFRLERSVSLEYHQQISFERGM